MITSVFHPGLGDLISIYTPGQIVGLVVWSALAIMVVFVLVKAAKQFPAAKQATDNGNPLPAVWILGVVGAYCWLCAHAPAPQRGSGGISPSPDYSTCATAR